MAMRNYLVEGGSGTGKSSVFRELRRRGIPAIDGDNELAYAGDPATGEPVERHGFETHVWDEARVRAIAANTQDDVVFLCGGSRNHERFLECFHAVFVLDVDSETLARRLEDREPDDWGGTPEERAFILQLNDDNDTVPDGIAIDGGRSIEVVVGEILALCAADLFLYGGVPERR